MQIVDAAFAPLIGQQCWNVQCGYGSWVTFEFGEPYLQSYRRLIEVPRTIAGQKVKILSRVAHLHGEWHLWIHNCFWRLLWHGQEALFCEDDRDEMRPILDAMSGAQLEAVAVSPKDGSTRFSFELGWVLETSPYESAISVARLGAEIADEWTDDGPEEQWMLFEPSGMVLSVDNLGTIDHQPGDQSTDGAEPHVGSERIQIALTGEERDLLAVGLTEWSGPTRGTTPAAVAMGFRDMRELIAGALRIAAQLRAGTALTPKDWARALIATELVFASDYYGSGVEWSTTAGMDDESTIRRLRDVQRKLVGVAKLGS